MISAVGHETDFTIADFVADCRAATPSAAAELVAPDTLRLRQEVEGVAATLRYQIRLSLEARRSLVERATGSRGFDLERRVGDLAQRLDGLNTSLGEGLVRQTQVARRSLDEIWVRVVRFGLGVAGRRAADLSVVTGDLFVRGRLVTERARGEWAPVVTKLNALSPLGTLARGYAICRRPGGEVVRDAGRVGMGDEVEVVLAKGRLACAVTGSFPDERTGGPGGGGIEE